VFLVEKEVVRTTTTRWPMWRWINYCHRTWSWTWNAMFFFGVSDITHVTWIYCWWISELCHHEDYCFEGCDFVCALRGRYRCIEGTSCLCLQCEAARGEKFSYVLFSYMCFYDLLFRIVVCKIFTLPNVQPNFFLQLHGPAVALSKKMYIQPDDRTAL
jgi:hypothetical protein